MTDNIASVEARSRALEETLDSKGLIPEGFRERFEATVTEHWKPENGANVVAKAWLDEAFRERLLADGTLPYNPDSPALPKQIDHIPFVTFDVLLELSGPESGIAGGSCRLRTIGVPVPIASINKEYRSPFWKNNVWGPG